jgi:ABC-type glycerol-3-phosphate transport system permease component
MRPLKSTLVYLVLVVGAASFVLPFAWMILTALKPLNQTMLQNRAWLPRRFEAPLDGRVQEVWPGAVVNEPSVWAREQGAAQPVVLAARSVVHGTWVPAVGAPLPVEVLKPVPASAAAPWREITDLPGARRDVVP